MGLLLDNIPAVRKAVARAERLAEEARDLALSGVDLRLCGLTVRQLTARHLMHLFAARSPFLFGGIPQPWQIAQFFLIVRPHDGQPYAPQAGDPFMRRVVRISYRRAVRAIDAYIDAAIMDRPAGSGPKRDAIAGTFASIVHSIATAYGWTRDAILDSPIAETYQYFRLIERDANPKALFFSPADKARRLALKRWKAAKAARAAKRAAAKGGPRG